MNNAQLPPDDLQMRLRALLEGADSEGMINPKAYWAFVAAIAQGRGIDDALHQEGLEAAENVPGSPASSIEDRKRRAYHIGFLARMVFVLGETKLLPENFRHRVVVADLLSMLDGATGEGRGKPQILYTKSDGGPPRPENGSLMGGDALRANARRALVGIIEWKRGASRRPGTRRRSREAIWQDLAGFRDTRTLKRWINDLGGPTGDLAGEAFEAGLRGDHASPYARWQNDPEYIAGLVKLAFSGQGPSLPTDD